MRHFSRKAFAKFDWEHPTPTTAMSASEWRARVQNNIPQASASVYTPPIAEASVVAPRTTNKTYVEMVTYTKKEQAVLPYK